LVKKLSNCFSKTTFTSNKLFSNKEGTIDATTFDSSNNSTNLIETSDKSKENNYKFSDTLLLPKTTFSQRAFASVRELGIFFLTFFSVYYVRLKKFHTFDYIFHNLEIQDASFKTLYSWQYNRTNVKGTFVLQDGPTFCERRCSPRARSK
jgi:hypothetical protein